MTDYKNDDLLSVNCGRCGKSLIVRLEDIRNLRTIDCDSCEKTLPTREDATRNLLSAIFPEAVSIPLGALSLTGSKRKS